MLSADMLAPLERSDGRRAAHQVHDALLESIMSGRIPPGAVLSQVEVAGRLNVSRTPVREAMRMLQERGLLIGEPNYRSRVAGHDPQDIESLYMKRIVLEALATSITTNHSSPELRADLAETLVRLNSPEAHQSFAVWQSHHHRFHKLMVSGAGDALVTDLEALHLRAERYQSARRGLQPYAWWQHGEVEHRELFDSMMNGRSTEAAELTARHLARTALELIAALAPDYDASKLRDSLRFAMRGALEEAVTRAPVQRPRRDR